MQEALPAAQSSSSGRRPHCLGRSFDGSPSPEVLLPHGRDLLEESLQSGRGERSDAVDNSTYSEVRCSSVSD